MPDHTRRTFVSQIGAGAAGLMAGAAVARPATASLWDAGPVRHILPSVSHSAMLLKVSFTAALDAPPVLEVDGKATPGRAASRDRRHWRFDVRGLRPDHEHQLRVVADRHGATAPWTLRTAPAPDSEPAQFRLLAFTCAGGDEATSLNGRRAYLPLETRRALLRRGLDFAPDAVLAIGDHVYWDQESGRKRNGGAPTPLNLQVGLFTPEPSSGENERILAEVGRRQIADLYGALLRSTPVWFVRDDHDYFENDEFYGERGTLPPSLFNRLLTDRLQAMFWPEFMADAQRPADLPGGDASFGTLRWGRLFEGLLYDCRGYLRVDEAGAGFVPDEVERWIARRTRDRAIRHVTQVPSTPWGWTAGKWAEWYPDALRPAGGPVAAQKAGWRRGWFAQHQRLLRLAGSRGRESVVLSGDLHAVGSARILASDGLRPAAGVHTVLAGPLGTDDLAFPSAFRSTPPFVPADLSLDVHQPPLEKTGFTVLDFSRNEIRLRQFAWRSPTPEAEIADLQPIIDKRFSTPA